MREGQLVGPAFGASFMLASYTERDMDGATAVTTKAAAMAAERGVIVVNSTGNGGNRFDANTLGAPADGEQVIAVGAVDQFGVRALFSSVGPTARWPTQAGCRGTRRAGESGVEREYDLLLAGERNVLLVSSDCWRRRPPARATSALHSRPSDSRRPALDGESEYQPGRFPRQGNRGRRSRG